MIPFHSVAKQGTDQIEKSLHIDDYVRDLQ